MDSIVIVLVEVFSNKKINHLWTALSQFAWKFLGKSQQGSAIRCAVKVLALPKTHVVLLSFVSSMIMFSIIYISSPCAAVGVSLHECVVTSGSPLVPLGKDTVASVVDAHCIDLKIRPIMVIVLICQKSKVISCQVFISNESKCHLRFDVKYK